MSAELQLHLHSDGDVLRLDVHNPGTTPLRLWQRDTPWGHAMLALHVSPSAGGAPRVLRPVPRRFTRSVPRTLEVAAGATLTLTLRAGEPAWAGWSATDPWLQQPLTLQAELQVDDTAPAREHQVARGRWRSAPATSLPPHAWLTGAS